MHNENHKASLQLQLISAFPFSAKARSSAQCNLLTVITDVLAPMPNKNLIGNSKIVSVAEAVKNTSFSLSPISVLHFGEDSSVEAGERAGGWGLSATETLTVTISPSATVISLCFLVVY
jgi:hypothetical protein